MTPVDSKSSLLLSLALVPLVELLYAHRLLMIAIMILHVPLRSTTLLSMDLSRNLTLVHESGLWKVARCLVR
jgi:hypothetical protein